MTPQMHKENDTTNTRPTQEENHNTRPPENTDAEENAHQHKSYHHKPDRSNVQTCRKSPNLTTTEVTGKISPSTEKCSTDRGLAAENSTTGLFSASVHCEKKDKIEAKLFGSARQWEQEGEGGSVQGDRMPTGKGNGEGREETTEMRRNEKERLRYAGDEKEMGEHRRKRKKTRKKKEKRESAEKDRGRGNNYYSNGHNFLFEAIENSFS